MPRISNKSALLETLQYFIISEFMEEKLKLLEDDDCLLLLSLLEAHRYSTPRIYKSIHSVEQNSWWRRALFDVSFDKEIFKTHFRTNKATFWEIVNLLKHDILFAKTLEPIHLQIAISLYRFGTYGNSSSLQHVATKFGISHGSVCNITERVIRALRNHSKEFITWPNKSERKRISEDMASKWLPKCIGFVDGTDVELAEAPKNNKDTYWSRKKKYCLQVQIICDPDKRIRNLFTGYPGSVHDAKVFSSSPIGINPQQFFSDGEYLIGDSAYSLTTTTIVPFRRGVNGLTLLQRNFNYHLSSERVKVEHAIGYLKSRFQSLKELRISINSNKGHQKACEWIHACVILHNILLDKDPWAEDLEQLANQDQLEVENEMIEPVVNEGVEKRQALLEIFRAMA